MRALVFVCALVTQAIAQQPTPSTAELLARCEAAKPLAIAQAKDAVESAKAGLTQSKLLRTKEKASRVAAADKQLKAAKEHLAALERGDELPLPKLAGNFKVGDFGLLTESGGHVLQVIDAQNVIVKGRFGASVPGPRGKDGIRDIFPAPVQTVWLRGFPTGNLTDEAYVNVSGHAVIAAGTKTYETVSGGSNTVVLLEAIDAEALRAAWKRGR